MPLKAPRAGDHRLVYSSKIGGRQIIERDFYYSDGKGGERKETFYLWNSSMDWVVFIMSITKDGKIIAVREFRHGANDFLLTLPGGSPKGTMSPKEVAEMEILEETGYRAKTIIPLSPPVWFLPAALNEKTFLFLGLESEAVAEAECEPNEVMTTVLVPLSEWYRKISSHEILDGKVAAISMLALPYLMLGDIKFK